MSERIIATCPKNNRSRYQTSLKIFNGGVRRVVLGMRDQNGLGEYKDTGPTVVFAPEHIDDITSIINQARKVCVEEGLLLREEKDV